LASGEGVAGAFCPLQDPGGAGHVAAPEQGFGLVENDAHNSPLAGCGVQKKSREFPPGSKSSTIRSRPRSEP
jgi:hypothetical protein